MLLRAGKRTSTHTLLKVVKNAKGKKKQSEKGRKKPKQRSTRNPQKQHISFTLMKEH
jgi:hypothetical protein